MSIIFNSMPFGMFTLMMLVIMCISVFEIKKYKSNELHAHKKYIMYSLLFFSPVLILRRYIQENSFGAVIDGIINIFFIVGTILFLASLFYAVIKTSKSVDSNKYNQSNQSNQQKSTLVTIGIMLVVVIAFILLVYYIL